LKWTDVSEVHTASIIRAMNALMMEAVRTSNTSVHFNVTTRRYIPENYKFKKVFNIDSNNACIKQSFVAHSVNQKYVPKLYS
jgi:hypothetical protein